MAKKKRPEEPAKHGRGNPNVLGLRAEVLEQPITETLEQNYMPYAMSVIVSRAIPEIDGFKPSHRKLLYTMYRMNLLTGARTKSANIVGQTMRLNPHGDAAIYETMVRLSKGYEALLTPFIDSKGNFGKVYSRDMAYAASRYTEAKLSPICAELFRDISSDTVDFTDNYDGSMQEPTLLPTTFPNVLVSANMGIAVGMASNICGFNLTEVCETAIALLQDPEHNIMSTLPGPDFPTGGELIYDQAEMESIYRTGRGSVKLRAKWRYVKEENIIEVYEIPYSTTAEAIMDKAAELIKAGRLREVSDMRDETDLGGLKLAIDLKRGTDPNQLMQKLFRLTPLQDSFSCNFNILVGATPRVLGVKEILEEWTAFRIECIKRRLYFDLTKAREKLHLLLGLEKILLDIDRAIAIVRGTEKDSEVVPNLMKGFDIDEVQAEYVAEIKLRHLNRQYILERTGEIGDLKKSIADMEDTLKSNAKIKRIIIKEVSDVAKKYRRPRRTMLITEENVRSYDESQIIDDYQCSVFVTKEGYFKKITPQSLRMSSEQKYKEGDSLRRSLESANNHELLIFTDRQQVYRLKLSDVEPTKASVLGSFLPSELKMDEGETVLDMVDPGDYRGTLVLAFANGKLAHIPLEAYRTKTNRKKLLNAYSDKSPLVGLVHLTDAADLFLSVNDGRGLVVNSSLLTTKTTRNTQGVSVVTLRGRKQVDGILLLEDAHLQDPSRYRARTIPKAPVAMTLADKGEEQMSLL